MGDPRVRSGLLAVALAAVLLFVISGQLLPAAQTDPVDLESFLARVREYVELRERLELALEPMVPLASPFELEERQRKLAIAVRRARLGSDPPRLIPPGVARLIRARTRAVVEQLDAPPSAEVPIAILPEGHPPIVNSRYPTYVPLSTVPPELLAVLPELPPSLQYRFHGDYLILFDAELALVLDYVADVLPPYTNEPLRAEVGSGPAPLESGVLPIQDGSVKFAVIGDTGTGGTAQRLVAEEMVEALSRFPFSFALMLGDNLYGDEDPDDYVDKFVEPYRVLLDAGVRFQAALGNHDEPTQVFYAPFNMGGRRYYSFREGPLEMFVLDTTYVSEAQVEWLRDALARSDAQWQIVAMHHPLYSTGRRHGPSLEIREVLEPVFIAGGVDLVFAGHEHFYERLRPQNGIYYITSGNAAKLRKQNVRGGPITAAEFDEGYSFTLVEIVGPALFFETISARGVVVDSGRLPRLNDSGRDPGAAP